jgi:hypothetical protein
MGPRFCHVPSVPYVPSPGALSRPRGSLRQVQGGPWGYGRPIHGLAAVAIVRRREAARYGLKPARRTKICWGGETARAPLARRSVSARHLPPSGEGREGGAADGGRLVPRRQPSPNPLTRGPPPDGGGGRALSHSPCGWERARAVLSRGASPSGRAGRATVSPSHRLLADPLSLSASRVRLVQGLGATTRLTTRHSPLWLRRGSCEQLTARIGAGKDEGMRSAVFDCLS